MKNFNFIILFAEDDDGHAELIKEYFLEEEIDENIIRFKNGLELWEYLNVNKIDNQKNTINYLVISDIRMPIMNGIELLEKIKTNEMLKTTPVIILSTSDDIKEVNHCYKLGCNAYISKSMDYGKFSVDLKRLASFIKIIKIPILK